MIFLLTVSRLEIRKIIITNKIDFKNEKIYLNVDASCANDYDGSEVW